MFSITAQYAIAANYYYINIPVLIYGNTILTNIFYSLLFTPMIAYVGWLPYTLSIPVTILIIELGGYLYSSFINRLLSNSYIAYYNIVVYLFCRV